MGLQKYKIYINGVPLFLISPALAREMGVSATKTVFLGHYLGKKKQIKQFLDLLDKNRSVEAVYLLADDLEALWQDFRSCFRLLEAAGGYVTNSSGQLLVFFRRGSWDMPKGKIDPGETPEQAAVREVQEETGIRQLHLDGFLTHTWHTYALKGERILKKTWWYRMETTDYEVVPQTEEDIEEIRWVSPSEWLASDPVVYGSIREVIELAASHPI